MGVKPIKVAILHQGFIPHYRVRFFELLNRASGTQYVVFHGVPASNTAWIAAEGPFDFPNRWTENRELHIGGWLAIYQPVIREILGGGYDAVVLGHEVKFLSNILLALLCKARGIRVVYWGFGYHLKMGFDFMEEKKGWISWLAARAKDGLTRLADGYLAYTKGGAERLAAIGFPPQLTFVLQNTIDISEQCRIYETLKDADPQGLRQAFGLRPDSVVLIYIGRLIEHKRVDMLIEAVARINREPNSRTAVEALIIGSGPIEDALKQQAGADPAIRFLGQINDADLVARYLKVAAAVVIPGTVGLAANHAFAQGRPIITRRHELHGPEAEYISDGFNGLMIDGDRDAFVAALTRFVTSPDWQRQLSDGALQSRDGLRLEYMVQQFDDAVNTIVDRTGELSLQLSQ
ncbi:MAG: glycosyltransferase family 4 protein [Candidatus Acidiferrales bacterium]